MNSLSWSLWLSFIGIWHSIPVRRSPVAVYVSYGKSMMYRSLSDCSAAFGIVEVVCVREVVDSVGHYCERSGGRGPQVK